MSLTTDARELLDYWGREYLVGYFERRIASYGPIDDEPLIIEALGRLARHDCAPFLLDVLDQGSSSRESKLAVLHVLMETKPREVEDQLLNIMESIEDELKGDLALVLAKMQSRDALPRIAALLDSPNAALPKVVDALGQYGEIADVYVHRLEHLYQEADSVLSKAVADSVYRIKGYRDGTRFSLGVERTMKIANRDQEARDLESELANGRLVWLQGMSGVGKSEFARWRGQEMERAGLRVVEIDFQASEKDSIESLQSRFLNLLQFPAQRTDAAARALDQQATLVICDNLEFSLLLESRATPVWQFLSSLIEGTSKAQFILISSQPLPTTLPALGVLRLDPLSSLEAIAEMLRQGDLDVLVQTPSSLTHVYRYVGGNPLYLQTFMKWIRAKGVEQRNIGRTGLTGELFRSFLESKEAATLLRQHFLQRLSTIAETALQVLAMFDVPFRINDYALGALLSSEGVGDWESVFKQLKYSYAILPVRESQDNYLMYPALRWYVYYQMSVASRNRLHRKLFDYFCRVGAYFEAMKHLRKAGATDQALQFALEHESQILTNVLVEPFVQWLKDVPPSSLSAANVVRLTRALAYLQRLQGEFYASGKNYKRVFNTCQRGEDKLGMAEICDEWAEMYLEQGYALEASTTALRAEKYAADCSAPQDLTSSIIANLAYGNLLLAHNDKVPTQSIEHMLQHGNNLHPSTQAQLYAVLIGVDITKGHLDSARRRTKQLQDLLPELTFLDYWPVACFIAESLETCENFEQAAELGNTIRVQTDYRRLSNYHARMLRLSGTIELRLSGSLAQAQKLIQESVEILERIDSPHALAKASQSMAAVLVRTGHEQTSEEVQGWMEKAQQQMKKGKLSKLLP